jgi:N4-gp56 family major capsid protein
MAITRFRPEIWSAMLLVALRKALVYGAPGVVNRDWEGEIAQAGDTVRITSIGDPTVADYVPNVTVITPQELTDAQRTLVVDQAKFFAFGVDDVDARQAKGNVITEAMNRAAYKVRDTVDQFIAAKYTQAQAANVLNSGAAISVPVATPNLAYDSILVPLKVALDNANVPTEGRYAIIPPWLHGRFLLDNRFIKVNEAGTSEGLRNGQVGRAAGFDILLSNNTPTPSAGQSVVQAGTDAAITFAEQINKTEAYRPQSSFSDAIKGLTVYGAKVIRPEALAVATVQQT